MNCKKTKYLFILLRFFSSVCEQTLFFSIPLLLYSNFNKDPKIIALTYSLIQVSLLIGLPISGFFITKILPNKLYFMCDILRGILCLLIYLFINNNIVYIFIFLFGFISAISFVKTEYFLPKILTNYSSTHKQSIMQIIVQSPAIIGTSLASFLFYFNLINIFLIIFAVIFINNSLITLFNKLSNSLNKKTINKRILIFKDFFEVIRVIISKKQLIYLTISIFILNFVGSVSLILSPHIFNKNANYYSLTITLSAIFSIFSMIISINKNIFKSIPLIKIGLISSFMLIFFFGVLSLSKDIILFSIGFILYNATTPFFVIFMRTERAKLIPKHIFAQSVGIMIFLYSLSIPLSGLFVTGLIDKYSSYTLLLFCFILMFPVFLGIFLTFNVFNFKKEN